MIYYACTFVCVLDDSLLFSKFGRIRCKSSNNCWECFGSVMCNLHGACVLECGQRHALSALYPERPGTYFTVA
jgi:hypothetical protein